MKARPRWKLSARMTLSGLLTGKPTDAESATKVVANTNGSGSIDSRTTRV